MPRELLIGAVAQCRDRDPLVRTMALLRASRVWSSLDREEARRIFAEGVATAETLSLIQHDREAVFDEAIRLGASIDPAAAIDLFRRQPLSEHPRRRFTGSALVQTLASRGNFELAIGLLEDLTCDVEGAVAFLHYADDPRVKRRALIAARERWRAERRSPTRHRRGPMREFYSAVSRHWSVLEDEANRWLDEILLAIESDPDEPSHFGLSPGVELHSSRDFCLFEILNVLRALRSAREVESILARHPDVAFAARTFPAGRESLEQPQAPVDDGSTEDRFCFVSVGSGSERDLIPTLMAAHRGDRSAPGRLLEEAHRAFLEDTDLQNGNHAPLPFWPSCVAYTRALYWAGRIVGSEAKSLVSDVPDRDLALLASVELAAGLLGLNESSGQWMRRGPRRR